MTERIKKFSESISARYPRWRTPIGAALVLVGFLALVTPFTPGSWLALVGLELLGIRVLLRSKKTN